jgi:Dyp-type peroxidase family
MAGPDSAARTFKDLGPALEDVQGEIFRGYDHAMGVHLLLHVNDAAGARAWLRDLVPMVTTAADFEKHSDTSLNVAFTADGLAAIGLPQTQLSTFPPEFREGMAARAPILGDTRDSAPSKWEWGADPDNVVHVWLMVQGQSSEGVAGRLEAALGTLITDGVARIVYRQPVANFTGAQRFVKEHFGFMDGIGEPAVAGSPAPVYNGQGTPVRGTDDWDPIALGSFLLGYENAYGDTPQMPADPKLRRNGTYMVFRKLEQHVVEFRNYLYEHAPLLGEDPEAVKHDPLKRSRMVELLAAKMVGRWRSGAPLENYPAYDPGDSVGQDPEHNNDFRYAHDHEGLNVPLLAHIRRANPRDSFPKDSVIKVQRHRIIRRSTPYGPWLPEDSGGDGESRGIVFRAYNANLRDQFELVQSEWISSANQSGGLSTDQDVIAGLTDPVGEGDNRLGSTMTIPLEMENADGEKQKVYRTLHGLPRFVTLRGGAYFFTPGISALRLLATDPEPER